MALSRKYTFADAWIEAVRDLEAEKELDVHSFEKFRLINRASEAVVGTFYGILSNAYMTTVVASLGTVSRYYVSGASWVTSTRLLTATMNTNFSSDDVGKLIVFRIGTDVYVGRVEAFVSVSSVTVSGDNLPSSDNTVNDVLLAPTAAVADSISIASLPIMRYGEQIKLEIESTSLSYRMLTAKSLADFKTWNPSSAKNGGQITFTIQGDDVFLKKASDIASYGTLTLHFPRTLLAGVSDTDYLDVPDGPAIELVIMKLKKLLAARYGLTAKAPTDSEFESVIGNLYKSFNVEVSLEEIKEKIAAFA